MNRKDRRRRERALERRESDVRMYRKARQDFPDSALIERKLKVAEDDVQNLRRLLGRMS